MSYRVRTQAYTGPFDLLLQLVSRQKVAIGAIAVADIADQYLSEVEAMEDLDLDVASDFLLVASTLLEIKAASLLPSVPVLVSHDDDDDDELLDLTPESAREVLIARLIAYKQFRNVASALASRMEATALMEARTAGPDPEFLGLMPDFLEGITLRSLSVICADLDSRRDGFLLEAEHVVARRIPIAQAARSVYRLVSSHGTITFTELLGGEYSAESVVTTFLAVLELFKRGAVIVRQSELFGEIDIAHVEGTGALDLNDEDLMAFEEDYDA